MLTAKQMAEIFAEAIDAGKSGNEAKGFVLGRVLRTNVTPQEGYDFAVALNLVQPVIDLEAV